MSHQSQYENSYLTQSEISLTKGNFKELTSVTETCRNLHPLKQEKFCQRKFLQLQDGNHLSHLQQSKHEGSSILRTRKRDGHLNSSHSCWAHVFGKHELFPEDAQSLLSSGHLDNQHFREVVQAK